VLAQAETGTALPRPGQVAWAPDGKRLALVRPGGVVLLDLETGARRELASRDAVSVDWAPAATILAVERDADRGHVVDLDPATAQRRELHSGPGLASARWLHGGPDWLAVAGELNVMSFGTDARLRLLRAAAGLVDVLHLWAATLQTRDRSLDVALGWEAAAPNPVDHGIVVPELHAPPLFKPYLRFLSVDPFDPDPVELCRVEVGLASVSTSWAPEGRRLAFAAADGTLRVLHLDGRRVETPAGAVRGRHPSWSPRGDVLFLGGWLASPSGAPLRELVPGARDSIGVWSPDGRRLAVLDRGKLFVLDGVGGDGTGASAAGRARASEALWVLGSLRHEGLVERGPYRERRERLRKEAKEVER